MDLSHTVSLSETAILQLIRQKGPQLQGLMLAGKPKLAEQFYLNVIPFLKNIKYSCPFSMIAPDSFSCAEFL
jgi:hypothetical protein